MREHYHVKFIATDDGKSRYEQMIKPYEGVAASGDNFEIFSALYGDGKSRYTDVTKIVREWGRIWPENWEEMLYATRKPRAIGVGVDVADTTDGADTQQSVLSSGLVIYQANYGIRNYVGDFIDVTEHLQSLVKDNSLDIIVNNSTLTPGQNPFRGKKKRLHVVYSIDGIERVERIVEEKDWLIIGPPNPAHTETRQHQSERFDALMGALAKEEPQVGAFKPLRPEQMIRVDSEKLATLPDGVITGEVITGRVDVLPKAPTTAPVLNDYLIRKFSISPQRLRGPMPIELRDFHRNDLARLFAELGFKRGAEIGVAEGNYSEVLLKANPECELLLVDPWYAYSENPQNKTKEKHEFAYQEAKRKIANYKNANVIVGRSMDVIYDKDFDGVVSNLDFVYLDGNHLFDYVMQDLIEWSKRVRSGGIVSGDDYYALDQKRWIGGGVVEAVQAYVNAHRIPVWYIFQGHKSVDYFWCKP